MSIIETLPCALPVYKSSIFRSYLAVAKISFKQHLVDKKKFLNQYFFLPMYEKK